MFKTFTIRKSQPKAKIIMNKTLPKVIVWDIDGTVWAPEMYQLWGNHNHKGFVTKDGGKSAICADGKTRVNVLADVREILEHLLAHPEVKNGSTQIAIASTCDEPDWARDLLRTLTLTHPETKKTVTMEEIFHHKEIITASNKKQHFMNISRKTGADLSEMIFFDNQMNNVDFIGRLGVKTVYTPDGVYWSHWTEHCGPKPDWASKM